MLFDHLFGFQTNESVRTGRRFLRKKQPRGIQENKIQGIPTDEEKAEVQKSKARSNDSNKNLRLVVGIFSFVDSLIFEKKTRSTCFENNLDFFCYLTRILCSCTWNMELHNRYVCYSVYEIVLETLDIVDRLKVPFRELNECFLQSGFSFMQGPAGLERCPYFTVNQLCRQQFVACGFMYRHRCTMKEPSYSLVPLLPSAIVVAKGHVFTPVCDSVHGGGMHGKGGGRACVCGRRDGHCSGRYTSYWNAFLSCMVI